MKKIILCPNPYRDKDLSAAREAADILTEATGADCVQVIGRKFVLFLKKKKDSAFDAILAK